MTTDNLGQLYADMFGPNQGQPNERLDSADNNLIEGLAKLYAEEGKEAPSYVMVSGRNFGRTVLTDQIKAAVEKHRYRQLLPLLGDEQKEHG